VIIAHAAEASGFVEEYTHLLQSAPHWAFELTVEAVTGFFAFLVGRWSIKRHDEKHHQGHTDTYHKEN
jgi:hypothetical protein